MGEKGKGYSTDLKRKSDTLLQNIWWGGVEGNSCQQKQNFQKLCNEG